MLDICEHDCNTNGLADECDVDNATSLDCDKNGVPDECEPDCNGNDIADSCDVAGDFSADCNVNGIPDECEAGHDADCNANAIPDLCDIASGAGADCNGNGRLDQCEILSGKVSDCTGNGIPDECEPDCNANELADSCDIENATSQDLDGNGVPDECAGFSLVPVTASGRHYVSGNTLTLVRGEQRIVAEFRMSGWDPDRDGSPSLRLYQGVWDFGVDPPFAFAQLTCANNEDCIGDSLCNDGVCDDWGSLNVDPFHPDYVFYGLDAFASSSTFGQFPTVFALLIDKVESVMDDGETRYGGTLVLDTHEEAIGEVVIGFSDAECIMQGLANELIPIPGFHALTLVVQEGHDLRGAAALQTCMASSAEEVGCLSIDGTRDGAINSQDVRPFTQLMSGPAP